MGKRNDASRPMARGMAALMAVTAVLQFRPATGAPGDIFSIPAPVIGADPPKATDIKQGDASVSTQTGALQYSYPIQVPPGRNGMAPQLAISYSSQAPTYGGLAAGWTLSIPMISEDHSQGRLRTRSSQVETVQVANSIDPKADDRFVSSMAGGRPLIAVTEPALASDVYKAYRAQNDASYTRYERMVPAAAFRWRARTSDGNVMTFGEASRMSGCIVNDQHALLTGVIDKFNNEVKYEYVQEVSGECRLLRITWGQNLTSGATLPSFAKVLFTYESGVSCNGVLSNSQTDYRTGNRIVTGASRLKTITATAYEPSSQAAVHTRTINLWYDAVSESCNQTHGPVRQLTSIQESARDPSDTSTLVDLPAITFAYNSPTVSLVSPQFGGTGAPWNPTNPQLQNLGWGYRRSDARWPSVESMFVDIDGDGLQDLLTNTSADGAGNISNCSAEWRKNPGPNNGPWTTGGTIALPRLKWRGAAQPPPVAGASQADRGPTNREGCALNGQATTFENSYFNAGIPCHNPSSPTCTSGTDPGNAGPYCFPGGTYCPPDFGGVSGGGRFHTYLAYRWLDADSDGLTDLVAAVHGDIDYYDIERGNLQVPDHTAGEPSISGIPGIGQWPACPGTAGRCENLEDCLDRNTARTCTSGLCTINWGAVVTCIANQPTVGCATVIAKPATGPENAPGVSAQRAPYMRCEGLYPWFIWKNQGNGAFATTPAIKYQPVPLESSSGDSSFGGPSIASENHGIVDFDGDGWLDAVVRPTSNGTGSFAWQLWLGDGTGGFAPQMYVVPTRTFNCPAPCNGPGDNAISGRGGFHGQSASSTAGLHDANGDGALDHWLAIGVTANANIGFSDGEQLRLFGPTSPPVGEISTAVGVKTGNDVYVSFTNPLPPLNSQQIIEGDTTARNRVVDVDHDGRQDVASFSAGPNTVPTVFFNVGGQFNSSGVSYPGDIKGVTRKAIADTTADSFETLRWRLNADLMDLDGDGVQESVFFDLTGFQQALPLESQPPRLLREVRNGRGAKSTITYAHMHDRTVVEQNASLVWPDGRPKASPRAQWVVNTIRSQDDHALTDGFTAYKYKNPRYGADDEQHYSFRGFEEVTTIKPGPTGAADGSRTIQRYGYNIDWSGRLVATVVQPSVAESATDARRIDKTTWQQFTLFSGTIKTFHPVVSEAFVCTNGQTESACTSAPAGYTKTTSTVSLVPTSLPGGSATPLMYQETQSLLQPGTLPANGDRKTDTAYFLYSDSSNYRVVSVSETDLHQVAGVFTMYAKTETKWEDSWLGDTSFRVPYQQIVWVDSDFNNRSVSRSEYDLNTGNVVKIWKPVQWAVLNDPFMNLVRTTISYDSRKLFPATEINEIGHVRDYVYEYGTGTKLSTLGPNAPTCALPQNFTCPPGTPIKEEHRIRVDGLGRMIERFEAFGNDGNVYALHKVEKNAYVDAPNPVGPNLAIIHEAAIDHTEATQVVRYSKDTTDLDGHGRPFRKTVHALGAAAADQVTTFQYRNDGTLAEVRVPDPTADNTTTVTYTYTFDSLGRPLTIRRPDTATLNDRSGVNITYNGLSQTSTEVLLAPGQAAETTTHNDSFGRLARVVEKRKTSPAEYSTTTYSYGPDDIVMTILDPESVTTSLTHDFAGRRKTITRNTRIWSYGYDKNGNMTSEVTPCTGAGCQAAYTTMIAYDNLDRPSSKALATRALLLSDRTLFGAHSETFTWDGGDNGKGRMSQWQSFGPPPSSTLTTTIVPSYNVQGQQLNLSQTTNAAGYTNVARAFFRRYHISGAVAEVFYRDVVSNDTQPAQNCTNGSMANFAYDARGLPFQVQVQGCVYGATPYSYLRNTRNVAGLVTKRHSIPGVGTIKYAHSIWSYDKLGRVTSQIIEKDVALEPVARQDVAYFGNDDPMSMKHWLGATNLKEFAFGYDARHQLTSVTTVPNVFNATYTYGDAGRFGTALEGTATPLPNGDVTPRNVIYQYSSTDPERLLRLRKTPGTKNLAEYTYDDGGNQLTRYYPDSKDLWEYVYDGKNQLRRATKKRNGAVQGSEEYWYDEKNARYLTVKRDAGGTKTGAIWFIEDTEAHYDASAAGRVTRAFGHVSMGTPVARTDRSTDASSTLEYQFHGLANNTLATVDQTSGRINASFTYAPFGEIIEATNEGAANGGLNGLPAHRRRMNDKFVDEVSGLAYYGFRYYDKLSMTWTQSDPLYRFEPDAAWAEPRRASLYVMSLNNPLRYVDPDGRSVGGAIFDIVVDIAVEVGSRVATAAATVVGGGAATLAVTGGIVAVGLGAVALKASQANPHAPGISVKHEAAYDQAAMESARKMNAQRIEQQVDTANANLEMKRGLDSLSTEEASDPNAGKSAGSDSASQASRGAPVAGTGKKAGRAFGATVKPGQPGPPKKAGTKPVKKSDAGKIAGRGGRFGGVVGSKTQAGKMDGRADAGHQGGPPHTHPTPQQGEGHFWVAPKPPQ